MQLINDLRGKTILLAGYFNNSFIQSAGQQTEQAYLYRLYQQSGREVDSGSVVELDSAELADLPDGNCDLIIISYAMLYLNRMERISLLENSCRILKPNGEIRLLEPVDEVGKKSQQQYLDFLKNSITKHSILQKSSLILPGVSALCNLFENCGMQIEKKVQFSGGAVGEYLQLPFTDISLEPSVHLHIKACKPGSQLSSSYSIDSEAEKMLPREKLLNGFIEEMKLAELLAVIIGMGNKQESVHVMTERIIREYGSKALAGETDPKRLMEILSIGEVNACKLVSAFEIGRRFYSEKIKGRQLIRGPEDVYKYASEMSGLVKENFRGLYLNTKNYIIHDEVISIGHLTASLVHPREVFKPAIEYSAAGLIVIHNHPSGDPEPSVQDKEITEMLVKAGKTLGIPLLDHVIIGNEKFYSFNEKGQI